MEEEDARDGLAKIRFDDGFFSWFPSAALERGGAGGERGRGRALLRAMAAALPVACAMHRAPSWPGTYWRCLYLSACLPKASPSAMPPLRGCPALLFCRRTGRAKNRPPLPPLPANMLGWHLPGTATMWVAGLMGVCATRSTCWAATQKMLATALSGVDRNFRRTIGHCPENSRTLTRTHDQT